MLPSKEMLLNGFCWPAVGIRDWGWHKQVKYIVEPGFYQVPNPLIMSLNTWKKLPKKFQDLLTEAASEAEKKAVAYFDQLAKDGEAYPYQGRAPGN